MNQKEEEREEDGNYDQEMKGKQLNANGKKKLGGVWVAVEGLKECSPIFEPLVPNC